MIRYVYVAGPLSAPTVEGMRANVFTAMAAATRLRDVGLIPFLPHLCSWWDEQHPTTYETWLALDFAWVERCDALLRLAPSPGTDREVAHALKHGKRVFMTIDELLKEAA